MLKKLLRGALYSFVGFSVLVFAAAVLSVALGPKPPAMEEPKEATEEFDFAPAPVAEQHPRAEPPAPSAEAVKVRTNGEYVTNEGFFAAATTEKLERANAILAQGDRAAFAALVQQDPELILLQPGLSVFVSEYNVWRSTVRIRLAGTLHEVWTFEQALGPKPPNRLPAAER